jgi:hypothetical protein
METVEVVSQTSSKAGKQQQDPVLTNMEKGAYVVEKDYKSERTH